MRFDEIQIGQKFKFKPKFCNFPYQKEAIFKKIPLQLPEKFIYSDFLDVKECCARNAIYLNTEYKDKLAFFVDDPDNKKVEDKFIIVD